MSNSTFNFQQQIVLSLGLFGFIAGLIGNPLSLIVFISLQTFRKSSCVFYLIIMSIVDTFHLFTGLLTYIMINGIEINLLNQSLFYCKFRPFYVQFCVLISFSCMCLATIDQYCATCSRIRWQQFCNIKLARYLLILSAIVWSIHGIPFLLYYDHIKSTCVIINIIFQRYYTFFHVFILANILPVTILILFAILAYRNVQEIAYRTVPLVRRETDKQLTVMVLVQVLYNSIVIIPFGVIGIFNTIFGGSNSVITTQLNFITTIVSIIYYYQFIGSFYIYICVSKRFRHQLIYVLFKMHFNRWFPPNQIEPQI